MGSEIEAKLEQVARLREERVESGDPGDFSADPLFFGEDIYNTLLQDLNLSTIETEPQGKFIEPPLSHPYSRALALARDYFSYFNRNGPNNGLFYQSKVWINQNYRNHYAQEKDSVVAGMGVVMRAFHLRQGEDFFNKIMETNPPTLMNTFNEIGTYSSGDRLSLMDSIGAKIKIPDFQVFLTQVLNRVIDYSPFEAAVADGATTMYHVVEKVFAPQEPVRNPPF